MRSVGRSRPGEPGSEKTPLAASSPALITRRALARPLAPIRRRPRQEEEPEPEVSAELVLAGRLARNGRLEPAEIAIDGEGRIASVGRIREGRRRHDVGESVIVPAATDLHVHFREPGESAEVESIATGTVEAALGGVGLVGDMPNTVPPTDSVDRLEEKGARVAGRAAVDVLLYAAPSVPERVAALARVAGAFKVYLSPTTGIDRPVGPEELARLLGAVARTDLPLTVHAEDPGSFRPDAAPKDPAGWNRARPPAAEAAALDRLLGAAPVGLRLHVAHVTTAASVQRLRAAGVSFEASPQHLLLSDRSGPDARFKLNPPLRTEEDRAALWTAYRSGAVPVVASDHAPHDAQRKALTFRDAPSGVPGVETMLPLLLARVRAGELPLERVVSTLADRPARWFGQPLGRIALGHRANLLVIDFRRRTTVRADRLHAPCGWTPFEGHEAIFPVEHWRDGERIVADGEYVGRPIGRVVRPEFAPGRRPPE